MQILATGHVSFTHVRARFLDLNALKLRYLIPHCVCVCVVVCANVCETIVIVLFCVFVCV